MNGDRFEVLVTEAPLGPAQGTMELSSGAVVSFEGVVRGETDGRKVEALEYEAYARLAEDQLRAIAADAIERWGLGHIQIQHRFGRLSPGEVSVRIVVTAPHRSEAFEACRYCIDRVKQEAAIWKKEIFVDGSEAWVRPA